MADEETKETPEETPEETDADPAGASDEVAVQGAKPAGRVAPKPAGNGAEGEASGGVIPREGAAGTRGTRPPGRR